ncbi:MAG: rhomboid family intramembrane serine protease [Amoebophilaceae bacterium]|nr:rhomboid family intramembrane serine protease [Amoebophilaceae bacterium]
MRFFLYDLKDPLRHPNHHLIGLILMHMVSFFALLIFTTLCYISGYAKVIAWVYDKLTLSSCYALLLKRPWALFTYSFIHKGIWSLCRNLLMIYYFGQSIQAATQTKHVLRLYFWGQLVGGAFFIMLYTFSPPFQHTAANLIGPSASIYAMMVATCLFIPDARVNLYITSLPLTYMVILSLLLSLMELQSDQAGNCLAQLGGALAGYLYARRYKDNLKNDWHFSKNNKTTTTRLSFKINIRS